MTRYYDELAVYERNGFDVIVDKSYEDIHPSDSFDDSCWDITELGSKIDQGIYEWFILRVRVLVDGHLMGSAHLGGMLYEDPSECLTDGSAEDMIQEALQEARQEVKKLKVRLEQVDSLEVA